MHVMKIRIGSKTLSFIYECYQDLNDMLFSQYFVIFLIIENIMLELYLIIILDTLINFLFLLSIVIIIKNCIISCSFLIR